MGRPVAGLPLRNAHSLIPQWLTPRHHRLPFIPLHNRIIAEDVPFWKSGILKWDGFLRLSDTAVTLFTDEFMLHLPGGPYPFPAPTVMAFLSGCAEITFPILLVLGLATRFAALGLLFILFIVELTVPDGWPVHITWAAMALAVITWGPGRVSLDFLMRRVLGLPNP